ncbi:MAG: methyltransferase domain-containing protein [Chloroflexi bacterium]|nr:methyltransferase domain-containing protein [Chloroflexota bacterium]
MNIARRFTRFFFHLLYHPFAFTYDLVAWIVSFGKWNDWVFSVFPYIEGTRILELGHGPGHLQRLLLDRGLDPAAIDESTQMGRLAKRRLGPGQKLTRGVTQALPFPNETFDSVVSTFPSDYIFDPRTLSEAKRTLRNRGRFIVMPGALPRNKFLKWLYEVTRESPEAITDALIERFKQPFIQAGFLVEVHILESKSSQLAILVATK